jgi:hypothetical protein
MTDTVNLTAVAHAREALEAIARAHPDLTTDAAHARTARWLHSLEAAPMTDDSVQLGVRIPRALLTALDREVSRMKAAVPGVEFTRSDAVRAVLTRALTTPKPAPAPPLEGEAQRPLAFALTASEAKASKASKAPPGMEALRKRYRAALDSKALEGSPTAKTIGCSEPMLRKWSKGTVHTLRPELLAALAALLDGEGL